MELYYIIHILVFLCCIFEFTKTEIKTKKKIIIFWCIFFTLFGGLRWRIGGDWDQYFDHYLSSNWDNIFNYDRYGNGREQLEPLFVFLNVFIKSIFGDFYWYNLIECGFIQYTIYHFCCRYSPTKPLLLYSWIIIAAFNYFPVRSGLAMSIGWWCFRYIQEQRLKPFLIIAFIAFSIHHQCIILFPLYWVGRIRINLMIYSIIYIILILISNQIQSIVTLLSMATEGNVAEKAYLYTQSETIGYAGPSYMSWGLNYFLILIFYWVGKQKHLLHDRWYNTLINTNLIYMAIFIVFSEGMGDLTRLASVIVPAFLILFITAIHHFLTSKNAIYRFSAISFFVLYYSYKFAQVGQGYFFKEANIPYKTIFDFNILN